MLNYAILGKGFIFSRHVEAINKTGGEVILTCDIDPDKKSDFLSYKEMFKSQKFKDEVNAIVICTPNFTHKQIVKDALATGKKVLCEKPLILDNDFAGLDGVNAVLQLRYHDMIDDIKKSLTGKDKIEITMKVCRDEKWWSSWRGSESKSGGILIGLAIHLFDFLIFLIGNDYKVIESSNSRKKCTGVISFPTAIVSYNVEILDNDNKKEQTRKFIINNKQFELCNKDNLSFAGYHDKVHREFAKGNGIPLSEARKSIELVLKLAKKLD